VLLNLRLDHKPPEELTEMFTTFRNRTLGPCLVGEDDNLRPFATDAVVFGSGAQADLRAMQVDVSESGSTFLVEGVPFQLPVPGVYNVSNAMAAIAACRAAGVELADMGPPLASFQGVARRFQTVGKVAGITVIDDFAHNPDKIGAALKAARLLATRRETQADSPVPGGRILALFQPHGFGPTRFLRDALVDAFVHKLGKADQLWMPEIYYAGGTVKRDISSGDIIAAVANAGLQATFVPDRADLGELVAAATQAGDIILVMGARDPSLTNLCQDILARLQTIHGVEK